MIIPGFIRGAANRGNKAAQAFVQQYDNGDNTPYDPNAYAAIKAQFSSEDNFMSDDFEEEVEEMSPEEARATEAIEVYGEKYRNLSDSDLLSKINSLDTDEGVEGLRTPEERMAAKQPLMEELKRRESDTHDKNEWIGNPQFENRDFKERGLKERLSDFEKSVPEDKKEVFEKTKEKYFGEDDIPDEKEIDEIRKNEERAKLDKEYPDKGNPEVEKEINKALEEKSEGIANSEEDDAGSPYKETDRQWMKDHIEDNPDMSDKDLMEDFVERFSELSPEDEQYVKELLKNRKNQQQPELSGKNKTKKMRELIKNNWKEAIGGFQTLDKLSDYQLELMYDILKEGLK